LGENVILACSHGSAQLEDLAQRTQSLLFTLADAAVAVQGTSDAAGEAVKSDGGGGFFGPLASLFESILKVGFQQKAPLFNPWVGHLGTWDFSWGRSQRNCTLASSSENPGMPLPISLRWLECVDDELLALAVKTLSLSGISVHL